MKSLFLPLILIFFVGCSSKEDVYITKRIYKDVSKDAVLEAGKKVFLLSDEKRDFIIDSYRNRLKVTKIIFKDRLFKIDLYQDKWLLEVVQIDNESRANLILVRSDAMNEEEKKSITKDVHEVFWARLEYLLGLNKDWKYCQGYLISTFDTSLCSNIFTSGEPKDSDMVKNVKIVPKDKIFTIDTAKSDLYEKSDFTLGKQNKELFEQSEKLPNIGIVKPVSDDSIMEIKAKKDIEEKIVEKNDEEKTQEDNPEDEFKDDEETKNINAFKNNLDDIVDTKNATKDVDTQKIVSDGENIKEDSQFNLKEPSPKNEVNKK